MVFLEVLLLIFLLKTPQTRTLVVSGAFQLETTSIEFVFNQRTRFLEKFLFLSGLFTNSKESEEGGLSKHIRMLLPGFL